MKAPEESPETGGLLGVGAVGRELRGSGDHHATYGGGQRSTGDRGEPACRRHRYGHSNLPGEPFAMEPQAKHAWGQHPRLNRAADKLSAMEWIWEKLAQ